MQKRIIYFLYTEEEAEWKEIKNDRFYIMIVKYNPKKETIQISQRFHVVYCDAEFTKTLGGQEIIRELFKSYASLGDREFYLI